MGEDQETSPKVRMDQEIKVKNEEENASSIGIVTVEADKSLVELATEQSKVGTFFQQICLYFFFRTFY
jgi:hypothetical protein